jgi:hypothetical protein
VGFLVLYYIILLMRAKSVCICCLERAVVSKFTRKFTRIRVARPELHMRVSAGLALAVSCTCRMENPLRGDCTRRGPLSNVCYPRVYSVVKKLQLPQEASC